MDIKKGCVFIKGKPTYVDDENAPYLTEIRVEVKYNPKFGDDRICKCGHAYYRHFDTYEDMEPCGCKYCMCYRFEEKKK